MRAHATRQVKETDMEKKTYALVPCTWMYWTADPHIHVPINTDVDWKNTRLLCTAVCVHVHSCTCTPVLQHII